MKNQAALITGSSKRVGKEIALALANDGFDIAVHYSSSNKEASQTAEEIKKTGVKAEIFKANLSNQSELEKLIPKVKKAFPNLELLINSASVYKKKNIKETDLDYFYINFDVNLKAPYFLSRDFAKLIGQGQIINITDANVGKNNSDFSAYLLSKKALSEFSKMAALEFAPKIRVNAVAPGPILAPDKSSGNFREIVEADIPLQKMGNPQDLIKAIKFLISHDYLTGQTIYVDGGWNLKK